MYQIPQLKKYPSLLHAFSEISDGNMDFRFGSAVEIRKNRERLYKEAEINPNNVVFQMYEVASDELQIAEITKKDCGRGANSYEDGMNVDCLITRETGIILGLLIADCIPVIMYDPVVGVLAQGHGSVKNSKLGVLPTIVGNLVENYGCDVKNLVVGLGPSIRKESLIYEYFDKKDDPLWKNFVGEQDDGRLAIDNVGCSIEQLVRAGVPEGQIFDCGINTGTDRRFYSHYAVSKDGGEEGRFVCLAGMK